MEKIKWEGYWWLPNSNKVIPGTLIFSPKEGGKLSLMGTLSEKVAGSIPFIHGLSRLGKKITLYNSICSKLRGSNLGFRTQEYTTNFLFEGQHFSQIKDLKFKKLIIEFHNTNKWLEFNEGFKQSEDFDKKTIKLEFGPNLNYTSKLKHLRIELNINFTVNQNFKIYKAIAEQKSIFSIYIQKGTKFDIILEYYTHLKNLLVFCTQSPIVGEKILLKAKLQDKTAIQIYFTDKTEKKLYLDEGENLPPVLIEGKYFQENFNQIVSNWFLKKEQLDFQIENFFNLYYFNAFTSDEFLTNARLLESLHKTFINEDNKIHQVDQYKEILLTFKRYIKTRLNIRNNSIWCKKIKTYRNELTHNNKINKSKALQIKDLGRITHESKLLILAFLLHQMDINLKKTGNLITKGFRFSIFNKNSR